LPFLHYPHCCITDFQPLTLQPPILHLSSIKSQIVAAQSMETRWRASERAPKSPQSARHRTHSRAPTATCTFNPILRRRSADIIVRVGVEGHGKRRRIREERKKVVPADALPSHCPSVRVGRGGGRGRAGPDFCREDQLQRFLVLDSHSLIL
jgi:hypothetical protein